MDSNSLSKALFRKSLIVAAVAAALGAGMAFPAFADDSTPKAHSDSVGAAISDTAITTKVKAKFLGKDVLSKSDIDVTTTNGVVTLTGSASSSHAKTAAEDMAKSIEGVKSVDNSLQVATTSTATAKANQAMAKSERVMSDSWITTKVKSEILADSISKGSEVHVKTVHGVVVLAGTLQSQDAVDHVKDLARDVDGVKSVNSANLRVASK